MNRIPDHQGAFWRAFWRELDSTGVTVATFVLAYLLLELLKGMF